MTDRSKTAARFEEVRRVFNRAIEHPPDQRAAVVAREAGADRALEAEVNGLLAANAPTGASLQVPTPDALAGLLDHATASMIGQRVGPYEIVRAIGFGGMGAVYEAHRADDHFRKRVAVKLIKQGMDSELAVRRFRHERQILAGLDHRNIAGLLDGGLTDDGRPYFVMEYVAGTPITTFCNRDRLPVRARLQLFRQVVAAVQFAHQNLVVHRDLKPGNILVADDGTVKLLDFGIAKILGEEVDPDAAPLTRGGLRALTPEYSSPEMFRGEPITVAADVYSLGVVLFELLAGRRPFRLAEMTLADLERAVLQDQPPRLPDVATDDHALDSGTHSAADLRKSLAGEIDTIVTTALRKEPERRYPSADAFGQDIKRWLTGQPIAALPDRFSYRTRKFIGRNRMPVATGSLLAASLVAGIVVTTAESRRANRERLKAEKVTEFLTEMLAAPEPTVQRRDITVAEILDSATARAARELSAEPAVQALVLSTIGHTYFGLGRTAEGTAAFKEAEQAYRRAKATPAALVVSLNNVAGGLMNLGRYQQADSVFTEALRLHTATGQLKDTIAAFLFNNLGSLAMLRGALDTAELFQRQALEARQAFFGEDNEAVALSFHNLAVAMGSQAKYAPAESLHRSAVTIMRKIHGDDHPLTASALAGLAGVVEQQGKPGADTLFQQVLAIRKKLLGADHPDYAWTLFNYSQWLADHGRFAEAVATGEEVLALRGKTLPDEHPAVAAALIGVGRGLAGLGRIAPAEAAIRESIRLRRASLPPGHWTIASAELALGEVLFQAGRLAAAEPILVKAHDDLLAKLGTAHPRVNAARRLLRDLYQTTDRPRLAAELSSPPAN